jgi:hypothetical protein
MHGLKAMRKSVVGTVSHCTRPNATNALGAGPDDPVIRRVQLSGRRLQELENNRFADYGADVVRKASVGQFKDRASKYASEVSQNRVQMRYVTGRTTEHRRQT